MPYRNVVTEDVLDHLQDMLGEQHGMVEELAAVKASNRTLRAIVGGLAILVAVGAVAIILSIAGIVRVNNTVDQQTVDRVVGCQVRNSNTDQLLSIQLAESLATADNLLEVLLPGARNPEETKALAEQWKAGIIEDHELLSADIKFVDCDSDGIKGHDGNGIRDVDDFPPVEEDVVQAP